jgi:hypothetical protein
LPILNFAGLNNSFPKLHLPGYIIGSVLEPRAPTLYKIDSYLALGIHQMNGWKMEIKGSQGKE